MKKRLLIVAPYCSLPGEKKFNRFLYLAGVLSNEFDVTLITSTFSHFDKRQRNGLINESENFNIVLIEEPGYVKNVSIRRVLSHHHFVDNFKKWMKDKVFDVVYSAYPLIETNRFLCKIKSKNNFKLIIDVQDVWPEAFSAVLPFVKSLPLWALPFTSKANYCYRNADGLVAVSKTYLERARLVNPYVPSCVLYIGSDFSKVNKSEPVELYSGPLRLVYIGSLGHSYDVATVVKAVSELYREGFDIEFHIFGGGTQENKLRESAEKNVIFHGYVNFERMMSYMKSCDVGVNALVQGAPQSITNKLSDYFSVGIPLLNSQRVMELDEILDEHSYLFENYSAGNVYSCKSAIVRFYDKRNSLAFKKVNVFDRNTSYLKLIDFTKKVLDS